MKDGIKPDPHSGDASAGDPELTRLFAERDEVLTAHEFLTPLLAQLQRNKRKEKLWKGISIAAGIAAAAYAIRELSSSDLVTSMTSIDAWTSEVFSTLDPSVVMSLLGSPMSWVVVCAIAATVLPAAYVIKAWK